MSGQCLLLAVAHLQQTYIDRAIDFGWDGQVAKAETADGLLITFGNDTNESDAKRFQEYLGLPVACIELPRGCSFTRVHPDPK
jgi:hypothetical protein